MLEAQAPGDLLRGPELLKAFDDLGKEQRTRGHLGWLRTTGLLLRPEVATPGPVVVAATIGRHFSTDGGGRFPDPIGDRSQALAPGQANQDFLPAGNRQSPRGGAPMSLGALAGASGHRSMLRKANMQQL